MGLLFNRKNDQPFVDFEFLNNNALKNKSKFLSTIDPKSKKREWQKIKF